MKKVAIDLDLFTDLCEIAGIARELQRVYTCQDMTEDELSQEIDPKLSRKSFAILKHIDEIIKKTKKINGDEFKELEKVTDTLAWLLNKMAKGVPRVDEALALYKKLKRPDGDVAGGKMRKKIQLDMTQIDVLVEMTEGNPGAMNAIKRLMDSPDGLFDVLRLDDMNIRGPQIWVGFKDVCNGDIALFQKKIRDRDPEMVNKINEEMFMDKNWTERARIDRYER